MSKFNIFNGDDIKKLPDVKPAPVRPPEPEANPEDRYQEPVRPPLFEGRRIVDADMIRDRMARPTPQRTVYVTLGMLLAGTLGMPSETDIIVNVGSDEDLTLLRPILGNRYDANTVIELIAALRPLRLQSLRTLASNNAGLESTFRIHSSSIVRFEVDRDMNHVIMFT